MNSLQDRLRRMKAMQGSAKTSEGSAAAASREAGEEPNGEEARAWRKWNTAEQAVNGRSFLLREVRYPLQAGIGRATAAGLVGRAELLARLAGPGFSPSAADRGNGETGLSHEQLLFLDIESTGLGVGTGNLPFLIGVGFYRGDTLTVRQLFIRSPAEEGPMLSYLAGLLDDFRCLVTFNGKSFDWPVIAGRYVMNRMKSPVARWEHLDLLYPSRRIWRNVLPSCRLGALETERLGLERHDDVPGSLAPELYQAYLRSRRPDIVAPVFLHNERDILAMVGLAHYFADVLDGLIDGSQLSAEEHYRQILLCEQWGGATGDNRSECGRDSDAGSVCDTSAAAASPGGESAAAAETDAAASWRGFLQRPNREIARYLPLIALKFKQQGRLEQAEELWLRCLAFGADTQVAPLEPYVQLAMLYEHRRGDLDKALAMTDSALAAAARRRALLRGSERLRQAEADLRRRRERLLRKKDRAESGQCSGRIRRNSEDMTNLSALRQGRQSANPPYNSTHTSTGHRAFRKGTKLGRASLGKIGTLEQLEWEMADETT